MKTYFITEGESDRVLLKRLFDDVPNLEFVVTAGFSSLVSSAVTFLIKNRQEGRVVVFMDSGSTDSQEIEARRKLVTKMLRQASLHDDEFSVVVFVPEMEIVFFEDPSILEDLTGSRPTPKLVAQGQLKPRQTLQRMVGKTAHWPLYDRLSLASVEKIKHLSIFEEVRRFLEKVPVYE